MILHNVIKFTTNTPKRTDDTFELEQALIKRFRGTTCLGRMKIIQAVVNISNEIEEEQKIEAAINHGKTIVIGR